MRVFVDLSALPGMTSPRIHAQPKLSDHRVIVIELRRFLGTFFVSGHSAAAAYGTGTDSVISRSRTS